MRAVGKLLVMVAGPTHARGRDGMTLPDATAWMVSHGATDAIALDT